MNLSRTTLIIGSGLTLLLIVGGVYFTNTFSKQPSPVKTGTPATEIEKNSSTTGTVVVPVDTGTDGSSGDTLDLSGKGLEQVPSYVFQRTEIEILDLSNNDLHGALQGEVRFLSNLKVLNLSNNNFTGLPAEIGQLSNLEVLDLSNNSLTGLPYELGNLKNLKTLDIRGNNTSPADVERIRKSFPATTAILE